jgi:hypothetical protein
MFSRDPPGSAMVTRRILKFATLDEAVVDAENLLAKGYDQAGQWNLGQCCFHIGEWMRYAMDGFPKAPAPIRLLMWFARNTLLGPKLLIKIVSKNEMRSGGATAPQSVGPAEMADAAGVTKFKETVERANRFAGPPLPSPLFGSMHRSTWVRLNCVHAAHHLSFLVPKS